MVNCQCSSMVHTGFGVFQISMCLLFTIIAFACPNWGKFTIGSTDYNFGLWEYCKDDSCESVSGDFASAKTKAARAFGILGMMAGVSALVLAVIYLVKRKKQMLIVAAIVSMVTFVLVLIGFILETVQVKDMKGVDSKFGFSFGLTLSGFIQGFVSGTSFFGAYRKAKCEQQAA